ncbi:unnamed protein product [Lactuca virosa]|uniref:Uncharacterized protein n=1 Tax=Lactuca virosa TaxID=75947 RepID=A0AAU9PSX3_9ASTR|nr:unnamed protein product [Lactuca virosa]
MENFQTTFNSNTTAANEALKSLGSLFKSEKAKLQESRTGLKTDHEAFQTSISSQITKLQDELANESNIKDSLSLKTEEVKVLSVKLDTSEKHVNDLLSQRAVMRSCITDVIGMLSDITETRDSMITISMCKHVAEKLSPVFAMLHKLEGVSDQSFNQKQGGEGVSGGSRKEEPKAPVKPVFKQEPKGKEKLFSEEPIVDNSEDEEELDENELKKQKAREDALHEHQRIIREAEEKERAEKEAQATCKWLG